MSTTPIDHVHGDAALIGIRMAQKFGLSVGDNVTAARYNAALGDLLPAPFRAPTSLVDRADRVDEFPETPERPGGRGVGERAVGILERTLGREHRNTATVVSNLARVLDSQGKFAATQKPGAIPSPGRGDDATHLALRCGPALGHRAHLMFERGIRTRVGQFLERRPQQAVGIHRDDE